MPDFRKEVARRLRTSRLRASQAEVVEEVTQHLEDRYAELLAAGTPAGDAEALVLAELQEDDALGEQVDAAGRRDRTASPASGAVSERRAWFTGAGLDVRIAARMLARAPSFTVVAALLIALGIGATTAFFTVLNAVLLRPLQGVADPGELVAVYTSDYSGPRYGANSLPDVEAVRESGAFAGIAAYAPRTFAVQDEATTVSVLGELVTADYFRVLRVQPAAGRFFTEAEGSVPGSAPVVVVSHAFWQERLGGNPSVVGTTIRVNRQPVTIIGVAPAAFRGMLPGLRNDVWATFGAPAALLEPHFESRGNRGFMAVARLSDGSSVEGAQTRLNGVAAQLFASYRDWWIDRHDQARVLTALPLSEARVPPNMKLAVVGFFALLSGIVGMVLLVACTNVANLMLSRATARQEEMGVRLALGATRGRIASQLLVESVLLALLGGAAGIVLAYAALRMLTAVSLPLEVPTSLDIGMDVRVLLFAAVVTLGTGILFGMAPALQAGRAPAPLLRGGAAGGRRMRLRNALVVVQVAASAVLLAAGGLFLRTLGAAQQVDTGMQLQNMVLVPLQLSRSGHDPERALQLHEELRARFGAVAGVQSVTLARLVPLGSARMRRSIRVEDHEPQPGEDMEFHFNAVGPGYFEAMGIRLLRGRGFTAADRAGAPPVVVVNEAFARRFWPGGDALGRRLSLAGPDAPYAEVVGVVPDAKYTSLTEDPVPYFYYPYLQDPVPDMTLQVRTTLDPAAVIPSLRAALHDVAPDLAPPQITTLRQHVGFATLPQRIAGAVLAVLGGLALLIAGLGLYGLVAFLVAQRTREIGIRTALGASAAHVQRMVLRHGVRLAAIGVVLGLLLAVGVGQALRSLLLVSPLDPAALGGAAAVLLAAAAVASWVPARRAARVDPLRALRAE